MKIAIASDHGGVGLKSVYPTRTLIMLIAALIQKNPVITLTMQKKRAGWCRMARQHMLSLFAVPVSACASQLIK